MTRATRQTRLTAALLAVYLLLIAGIILFKLPFRSSAIGSTRALNLIPLVGSYDGHGRLLWREITANTLIFIPFGVYLGMLHRWTFVKRVLSIAGLSLGFELAQYILGVGVTDITDLIDNTIGGIVGLGIIKLLAKLLGARTYGIVNTIASAATIVALLRFSYFYYLSYFVMGLPPR
ncbi:MAG: VanZ family protein [Propionibacteriaceae bacterium]|jgi:glycopeptide antibiotics resistance protein|nr:VanZ family protein [Propionibacteriaceae bacterium]